MADACTRIGVEAALDSHAIAKDVFSGDTAPRSFALESLFAQTVTPGVTDSKGFIARETKFAWHDARGDVRANLALFLQPAYMQATKAAVPVSALLDHCTRLHDAFTVKAIGKAGKFTPDATTCGTHGPIDCKQVGAGNTRGNEGYASKTHTDGGAWPYQNGACVFLQIPLCCIALNAWRPCVRKWYHACKTRRCKNYKFTWCIRADCERRVSSVLGHKRPLGNCIFCLFCSSIKKFGKNHILFFVSKRKKVSDQRPLEKASW